MKKIVFLFLVINIICVLLYTKHKTNIPLTELISLSEYVSGESILLNMEGNYNKLHKAALVLEGGSLRSLYTSGVLDVFMENGIRFELIIAVSAGALNAGNYIANHIGRSAKINILHSNDSNYYGYRQLIFYRRAFNFDYVFYSPMNDLYPYNEEALLNSQQRLLIAATNIETGNAEYFERNTYKELVQVLQASSSIPLLSQPVNIDGNFYLDGAIDDPIGLNKALSEGYEKIIVILTNHSEYRLPSVSWFEDIMIKFHNRKYPKLMETIKNRHLKYNSLMDKINNMELDNQIFVIRSNNEFKIKTMEKDARKLIKLYFQGRDDARKLLPKMMEYIKENNQTVEEDTK